ncbi:MAG: putative extra-cytoplasmic solute receptor [Rhizobacter sp.]|nr:putative extra-cytoplasmic solute receptor [Rhizobacter sp.]
MLVLCTLALTFAVHGAQAADYPNKPIRMVVPYPPGGTSEVLARVLAKKMSDGLGQQIYIDNIGGAGSTLGSATVARAAPDGYTILFGYSSGLTMAPAFYSHLAYDPLKSFAPIGSVARFYMLMAANTSVPANNMKELVALAKAHPGELTYGTAGAGSSPHLLGEVLRTNAGIDITHVPYKGMAPALLDVGAGRVSLAWDAPDGLRSLLQTGKIKPLAVTSPKRLPELPNVPTVGESGFPELELFVWTAMLAPAGTPPEIIARLEAELGKALAAPDLRQLFESRGYEMFPSTADGLMDLMRHEVPRYAAVVKKAGATID